MYFLMRGFAQDRGFLWGELCATRPLLFLGRANFFSDVPKVKNVIRLSRFDPFIRITSFSKMTKNFEASFKLFAHHEES